MWGLNAFMIEAAPKLENLRLFTAEARKLAAETGVPAERLGGIELAVEEVFVNICQHAGEAASVRLECVSENNGGISIVISDDGVPFNPLECPDPELDVPLEEREVGGLGIFLVKNTMDGVRYERRDGRNVLTLTVAPKNGSAKSAGHPVSGDGG